VAEEKGRRSEGERRGKGEKIGPGGLRILRKLNFLFLPFVTRSHYGSQAALKCAILL
jgi:hypothetical protein